MGKLKVAKRHIIANAETKNSHSFVEFRAEEAFSNQAEAALLKAAGNWIGKHEDWGLIGMQLEHRPDYTLFYIFLEQ